MNLAFLRSLGVGEDPVGEAKVHLRKAKLIFDLGKNTLALARLPKDYEISRNILETAKGHLDEAARAMAEALRGEYPVDELLPQFRSLSREIPEKMEELRHTSSGLGDATKEASAILKDPEFTRAILSLDRWFAFEESRKAGEEKLRGDIQSIRDRLSRIVSTVSSPDFRPGDIAASLEELSRVKTAAFSLPEGMRGPVGRMIKSVDRIVWESIPSLAARTLEEAKRKEEARRRGAAESRKKGMMEELRRKTLERGAPVNLFELSKTSMLETLRRRSREPALRFGSKKPLHSVEADFILTRAEQLISQSEDALRAASGLDPETLRALETDFDAAKMIISAREHLTAVSGRLPEWRWRSPEKGVRERLFEETLERIKKEMGEKSKDISESVLKKIVGERLESELVIKSLRLREAEEEFERKIEKRKFMNRLKAANVRSMQLIGQSNLLRELMLGIPGTIRFSR